MKATFICATVLTSLFFIAGDKLTGRWQTLPSPAGHVTGIVFKADNTFEAFVDKKAFASGNYTIENDIFTFTDNGCNGQPGSYKLNFFSNEDSLRFEPVADSCTQRVEGIKRLTLGRVKK